VQAGQAVAGLGIVAVDHRRSDVRGYPDRAAPKAGAAGIPSRARKLAQHLAVIVDQVGPIGLLIGEPEPFWDGFEAVHLDAGPLRCLTSRSSGPVASTSRSGPWPLGGLNVFLVAESLSPPFDL